jgi:hypothetical protein
LPAPRQLRRFWISDRRKRPAIPRLRRLPPARRRVTERPPRRSIRNWSIRASCPFRAPHRHRARASGAVRQRSKRQRRPLTVLMRPAIGRPAMFPPANNLTSRFARPIAPTSRIRDRGGCAHDNRWRRGGRQALLHLNAGPADDVGPLGDLGFDERLDVRKRHAHRQTAIGRNAFPYFGIAKRLLHFGV